MTNDIHLLTFTLASSGMIQGEKLLRRAEMCRKLESDQEKVLPFYMSSLTLEEENQAKAQAMEPPSEELAKVFSYFATVEL